MSYYILADKDSFQHWNEAKKFEVLTPGEFMEKDGLFHESVKGVVIPCELNLDDNNTPVTRDKLYGINLARILRLQHQRRYPVLFVSFLPFAFIKKQSTLSVLVESIGHDFLRLPCNAGDALAHIKQLKPLTAMELRDVQLFSCKADGIISAKVHQLHQLTDKMQKDAPFSGKDAFRELIDCLNDIHQVAQQDPDKAIAEYHQMFPEINQDNVADACSFVKSAGEMLIRSLVSNAGVSSYNTNKKRPWKLLMLEDELDKESEIARMINARGIDIVLRTNAEGAMRALDRDDKLRGKIALILCDYRLYEEREGGKFQQKTQGYSFLQQVGERFQSRILSAVVYSGMPRQFLLETFRTYKLRTEIFSKADFGFSNHGALEYMTNRIAELGDANHESMMALPMNNSSWESKLHPWYVYFRSLKDYEQRENEISAYCNQWVNDFVLGNNPPTPLQKAASMPEMPGTSKKCPQCGNTLSEQKPFEKDISEDIQGFTAILKARRLAQYLYLVLHQRGYSETEAFEKIHQIIKPPRTGSTKEIIRQQRFKLGLKLSEFPMGATIEELNWLHYDRGIEVLNAYKRFRQKIQRTEELTSEFIHNWSSLQAIIKKQDYNVRWSNDSRVEFNKKDYQPYLFDRNDIGMLIRWLGGIVQGADGEKEMMKEYMEHYCESLKGIWKWQA